MIHKIQSGEIQNMFVDKIHDLSQNIRISVGNGEKIIAHQSVMITFKLLDQWYRSRFIVLKTPIMKLILGLQTLGDLRYSIDSDGEKIQGVKVNAHEHNPFNFDALYTLDESEIPTDLSYLDGLAKEELLEQFRIDDSFPPAPTLAPYELRVNKNYPFHVKVSPYLVSNPSSMTKYLAESVEQGLLSKVDNLAELDHQVLICPVFETANNRVVFDLRRINKFLRYTNLAFSGHEDIFQNIKNFTYYTLVDLSKAFNNIPLSKTSVPLYITLKLDGHIHYYRCHRLPFGLSSATAIFNSRMNTILDYIKPKLQGKFAIATYVDDVILCCDSLADSKVNLKIVLQILQEFGVKINREKLKTHRTEVDYLGFTFSKAGITISEKKIEILNHMKVPQNVMEVKSVLGFLSFLRLHIPYFSEKSYELHHCLKKGIPFNQEAIKKSFETTREAFYQAAKQRLSILDLNNTLYIYSDSSQKATGSILFHKVQGELKIVGFNSHLLSTAESHYGSSERELLAIVHALNSQKYIQLHPKIQVLSDNKPLSEITKSNTNKTNRVIRLLTKIQHFNYSISYIKGCLNFSDALSRYIKLLNKGDSIQNSTSDANLQFSALDANVSTIPTSSSSDSTFQTSSSSESIPNSSSSDSTIPTSSSSDSTVPTPSEGIDPSNHLDFDSMNSNVPSTIEDLNDRHIAFMLLHHGNSNLSEDWNEFLNRYVIIKDDETIMVRKNKELLTYVADKPAQESLQFLHSKFHSSPRVMTYAFENHLKLFSPSLHLLAQQTAFYCSGCSIFRKWTSLKGELAGLRYSNIGEEFHADYVEIRDLDTEFRYVLNISERNSGFLWSFASKRTSMSHVANCVLLLFQGFPNYKLLNVQCYKLLK